jgi:hypothetical protein
MVTSFIFVLWFVSNRLPRGIRVSLAREPQVSTGLVSHSSGQLTECSFDLSRHLIQANRQIAACSSYSFGSLQPSFLSKEPTLVQQSTSSPFLSDSETNTPTLDHYQSRHPDPFNKPTKPTPPIPTPTPTPYQHNSTLPTHSSLFTLNATHSTQLNSTHYHQPTIPTPPNPPKQTNKQTNQKKRRKNNRENVPLLRPPAHVQAHIPLLRRLLCSRLTHPEPLWRTPHLADHFAGGAV